jgi:hypothetical protein
VGAFPLIVTVPFEPTPPTTDVGETLTFETVGAVIVRTAVAVVPFTVAVMVAVVLADTAVVLMVNTTDLDPAEIVAVDGTVADVLSEDNVTVRPPVGAGPAIVRVALEMFPPITEAGFSFNPVDVGIEIPNAAVAVPPLAVAVM